MSLKIVRETALHPQGILFRIPVYLHFIASVKGEGVPAILVQFAGEGFAVSQKDYLCTGIVLLL